MKILLYISLCFAVIIMGLTIGADRSSAKETGLTPTSDLPWFIQDVHQVDPPQGVGLYTSLALNPIDNLPYISYMDGVNGNLNLAHLLPGGGGNCGTNNNWQCEILDGETGDDVGAASSLAFWADESTNTWKIGVSYHDQTNKALKFISWTCVDSTCTYRNKETIFSDPTSINVALSTSLKFSPDGIPNIAYNYLSEGNDSVRYAYYIGSSGNCGEGPSVGMWQCTIVDDGDWTGRYLSLDITYDGSKYIAYSDGWESVLKLARYVGIIPVNCYDDNGWFCGTLDDAGDVGRSPSLVAQRFAGDVSYQVAYVDASNEQLKYVAEGIAPMGVDELGPLFEVVGISMNLDENGYPIIAYGHTGEYISSLKIARPYMVFNDNQHGNCGDSPPPDPYQYWRCTTIVPEEAQYIYPAFYVSVVVSPNGLAQVAYSEQREFNSSDLKFISQRFIGFLPVVTRP